MQSCQRLLTILGMETKTAIEKAGGTSALAKLLGISSQAISQWGENVPRGRYWQLKVIKPDWFLE